MKACSDGSWWAAHAGEGRDDQSPLDDVAAAGAIMSFIHPLLLAGLAVAALPIIIHLINQWRYQTIRWGAMMFLLAANRMSRGFARLRQWLILLMRVLAIACLVFVIARPLAGGWLALTAGGADTTIVLLDRSPSMAEQDSGSGQTKLAAGRRQLADALGHLRSSRWILIESTSNQPRELESPAALAQLAETGPASASADLPAMLSAARDYMTANQTGRTEIWICSDLRANDWNADDARWETLRSAFAGLAQSVRINLLALAQTAPANLSIATTRVRRRETDDGAELLVSLRVEREGSTERPVSVPIQFDIEGIKSVVNAEFAGSEFELRDHRIPLGEIQSGPESRLSQGWGRVSLPADANLADNDSYFVFSEADEQRSVIIADEPAVAEALRLAASVPVDPAERSAAAIIDLGQLATIEWDKTALVLWQAPLPEGQTARQLEAFVDRGGQVIFFPPRQTGEMEIFGARWSEWHEISDAGASAVDGWRGDEDLLANTQSGQALPVGELKVRNVCSMSGEVTPLATLVAGQPLLARAVTPRGGVY
ncbi:MAG TPA: BatA domain-containing protein, partial [Pirellulales bacterium]|nr:BatA domain-containing protein [Pirellulales bacterium]